MVTEGLVDAISVTFWETVVEGVVEAEVEAEVEVTVSGTDAVELIRVEELGLRVLGLGLASGSLVVTNSVLLTVVEVTGAMVVVLRGFLEVLEEGFFVPAEDTGFFVVAAVVGFPGLLETFILSVVEGLSVVSTFSVTGFLVEVFTLEDTFSVEVTSEVV